MPILVPPFLADTPPPSKLPTRANISTSKPSTPHNKESPRECSIRCPTLRIDSLSISTHTPHVSPPATQSPQQIKPFPQTAESSMTTSPCASTKMPARKISPVSTEKPSALLPRISQMSRPSADINSSTIPATSRQTSDTSESAQFHFPDQNKSEIPRALPAAQSPHPPKPRRQLPRAHQSNDTHRDESSNIARSPRPPAIRDH